jgi:xanthine dehydrogenase accessory factor
MAEMSVLVKGGGDLGTGVVLELHRHGYQVVVTELPQPLVVRRTVAMASAVYTGSICVEGVTARLVGDLTGIHSAWEHQEIPVLVDPIASIRGQVFPQVIVDAILAKHNTGTCINDAQIVVGLGPGFQPGVDCHAVIETQRGPNLGSVILNGVTAPDSGVPGAINGETIRRILRAPQDGTFISCRKIGDHVNCGDVVAEVNGQ